jgi:hypothetical protein
MARKSAISRGNQAKLEEVDRLDIERVAAEAAVQPEGWAVNRLVHFNEWANPTVEDFRLVVDAYRRFSDSFGARTRSTVHGYTLCLRGSRLKS